MQLRDRVDQLDCQQRQQLEQLRNNPTAYVAQTVGNSHLLAADLHHDSPARSVDSDRSQS